MARERFAFIKVIIDVVALITNFATHVLLNVEWLPLCLLSYFMQLNIVAGHCIQLEFWRSSSGLCFISTSKD